MSFCLLKLEQYEEAAAALQKSVSLGNDTDWQLLVELLIDQPQVQFRAAPRRLNKRRPCNRNALLEKRGENSTSCVNSVDEKYSRRE